MEVDLTALQLSTQDILMRLLLSMLVGAVIGLEREFTQRPAGLRTHMLVALGASAVMLTGQLLFSMYHPYGATLDPGRLSAQVIAGVGFLGAGTILREGATVKGLTTAASIWAVACLGIVIGAGFYTVGLIGAACIFLTLTVFEWLQKILVRSQDMVHCLTIRCTELPGVLEKVNGLTEGSGTDLLKIQLEEHEGRFVLTLHVKSHGKKARERVQAFMAELMEAEAVVSAESDFQTV